MKPESRILERLTAEGLRASREREKGLSLEEVKRQVEGLPPARGFAAALESAPGPAVIAEVKRRSPSAGAIAPPDMDPGELARSYEAGGASALSVLTEGAHFGGDPGDLEAAKGASSLPVLRKDFILTSYGVYESRLFGADAVLLIATLLEESLLRDLIAEASAIGLDALVECHHQEELEKALRCGARVVGINNRDLRDFSVDLSTTERLVRAVPQGITVVAESGINGSGDILRLARAGVKCFLVGTSLVSAPDPERRLREWIETCRGAYS